MQGSSSSESLAASALNPPPDPGQQPSFDATPLQSHLERLLQLLLGAQERDTALLFATAQSTAALIRFAQDDSQKALYINKLLVESRADAPGVFDLFHWSGLLLPVFNSYSMRLLQMKKPGQNSASNSRQKYPTRPTMSQHWPASSECLPSTLFGHWSPSCLS